MKCSYLLLLATFAGISSPSVVDVGKAKKNLLTDLDYADIETNALRIFNTQNTVLQIADALIKLRVPIKKLFTVRSWYGLEVRSNLPYVRKYIQEKVTQFYRLDLDTVFKLLGKVGELLRVANAGCNGFKCSQVVVMIMYKYQNLMTDSTKLSQDLVNVCIKALRFHRYSYYFLTKRKIWEKSLKQFKRTIPLAVRVRKESKEVASEAQTIRNMSMSAWKIATDEKQWSKDEQDKFKGKISEYTKQSTSLDANIESLKLKARDLGKLAAQMKEDEGKVDTTEELERKKSILSEKCVKITKPKFKEVCNTARSWWGWSSEKKCQLKSADQTELDCRMQIDSALAEMKKERLRDLASRRKYFQEKRIEYQEKKLEIQTMQREQFAALRRTGEELKQLRSLEGIKGGRLRFAVVSLDLAAKSMIIVQTQLKRAIQFWEGVVEHTSNLVDQASDNTTDEKMDELFKEKLLESGFSWLALGKVLRVAAIEMRTATNTVDQAFMKFPTNAEVKQIIEVEGQVVIEEAIALSARYDQARNETLQTLDVLKREQKENNILLKEIGGEKEEEIKMDKNIEDDNFDDDGDDDEIIQN